MDLSNLMKRGTSSYWKLFAFWVLTVAYSFSVAVVPIVPNNIQVSWVLHEAVGPDGSVEITLLESQVQLTACLDPCGTKLSVNITDFEPSPIEGDLVLANIRIYDAEGTLNSTLSLIETEGGTQVILIED